VEVGAVLPHQDLPRVDHLPAEPLDAQPLRVRVAAVLRAGRALLVCHPGRLLPALDPGHLHLGQLLPVALALVVAGLVLELVNPDLGALGLGHDLAGHRNLGERVGVGGHGLATDGQPRGKRHRRAGLTRELLHLDDVADSDAVLLAAGLDDRVHETTPDVALWDLGSPTGAQRDDTCRTRERPGYPGDRTATKSPVRVTRTRPGPADRPAGTRPGGAACGACRSRPPGPCPARPG